jgi:putative endonuclease
MGRDGRVVRHGSAKPGTWVQVPFAPPIYLMYHAYVLKSESADRLYKGSCQDLELRLSKHNAGTVKSTKPYLPWHHVYSEAFETRSEAFQREHHWKTAAGARELRRILADRETGLSSEP